MSEGEMIEVTQPEVEEATENVKPSDTPLEKANPSAKEPGFIREFSKENSQEERDAKASEIRQKRSEYFARKAGLKTKEEEIIQEKKSFDDEVTAKAEELVQIQATIDALSDSWAQRTLNFLELKKLNKSKTLTLEEQEKSLREVVELEKEEQRIRESLAKSGVEAELGEARELLKKFYDSGKKNGSRPLTTRLKCRDFFLRNISQVYLLRNTCFFLKDFHLKSLLMLRVKDCVII